MNPQAEELNQIIREANPAVHDLLSKRGREIFFPKLGILSQSAAAKGKKFNATIGEAREDDGTPMCLDSLSKQLTQPKGKAFPYSPSPGNPDIRKSWKEMLIKKNPGLKDKSFSQPVATCGITHALSIAGFLFNDQDSQVCLPDLYWENYNLIFSNWFDATVTFYNLFQGQGLDLAALEHTLSGAQKKITLLLNFPNNPSGYTPTEKEAESIKELLLAAAKKGKKIIVLLDDAYFGLVYEKGIIQESLFTTLVDLHENVLTVKLDGPTKEDYVWGFRVGFITFGVKGGTEKLYSALEAKAAGAIRGNISNITSLSQNLLLDAYSAPGYTQEKQEKYSVLKNRYDIVQKTLKNNPAYAEFFQALPYNSGYFMCIRLKPELDSEKIWKVLLDEFDTGVIHLEGIFRIAFSSISGSQIPELFENIYQAIKKVV